MKNQTSKFPNENDLQTTQSSKPPKQQRQKTQTLVENEKGIFEVPEELEGFQRAQTQILNKPGDFIQGLYEGLQPVVFKNGKPGALCLLRQQDGSLHAVNANADIIRFLGESNFDEYMGEFLRIILDELVNVGQVAPFKKYRYQYSKKLELKSLKNVGLKQLESHLNPNLKLLQEANEMKSFSPVLEVEKE